MPANKKLQNIRLLSIILLVLCFAFTVYEDCLNNGEKYFLYIFSGIAVASFFTKSADTVRLKITTENFSFTVVGALGLIIALVKVDPIEEYKSSNCYDSLSLVVNVRGKHGIQDIILKDGYVLIEILDKRSDRKHISQNGQATFQNLSIGDRVKFEIDFSEPYHAIYPDSIYTVPQSGIIYFPIFLSGIDKIKGQVFSGDLPLAMVTVKEENTGLITQTDSLGDFMLTVPDSLQRKEYNLKFFKHGYTMQNTLAYPQTEIPVSVVMEKN